MHVPGTKHSFQETSGMVELVSNGNKKKKFGLKIFSKSGKVAKSSFHDKKKVLMFK